jgi:hypothetical protein
MVSHYSGEMVIRIGCNQLGENPNTNPGTPAMVALDHLWYYLGSVVGLAEATHSGTNQLLGCMRPCLPLVKTVTPHILPPVCAPKRTDSQPE